MSQLEIWVRQLFEPSELELIYVKLTADPHYNQYFVRGTAYIRPQVLRISRLSDKNIPAQIPYPLIAQHLSFRPAEIWRN